MLSIHADLARLTSLDVIQLQCWRAYFTNHPHCPILGILCPDAHLSLVHSRDIEVYRPIDHERIDRSILERLKRLAQSFEGAVTPPAQIRSSDIQEHHCQERPVDETFCGAMTQQIALAMIGRVYAPGYPSDIAHSFSR